jgi:uncharacterized protein YjcR
MKKLPATSPRAASKVTMRWKRRVGWSTMTAISASTIRAAMKPGRPVM